MTPVAKRSAVVRLMECHQMSERRACHLVGADRTMIRYGRQDQGDEALRDRMRELAGERHEIIK